MATKFISIEGDIEEEKHTIFRRVLRSDLTTEVTTLRPSNYDNVFHIGASKGYGDVFKAWDDDSKTEFTIFFGIKGDEFNQ